MGITSSQHAEMDISAFLNLYVYQDEQMSGYAGMTISEIAQNSARLKDNSTFMNILNENPSWGNIVLKSQSSVEGKVSMGELVACAFEDPNTGTVYVAYRGTGDGKWVDNGVGMANENSLMQRRAEEYFDSVIEDCGLEDYSGRIVVTGHSKGGNSAQYVTLSSKYGHLVNNCYSMNGQGFSEEAIERFKELYGEDYYNDQVQKMYGINGDNDYVSPLGITTIPQKNIYYVETTAGDGPGPWHQLEGFFYDGDDSDKFGKINFKYENGEIVSADRGPISIISSELSANMMILNEEDLEDCTVTIMTLLEKIMGDSYTGENNPYGTGDVAGATYEEIFGFIAVGVPVILDTVANSDEAKKLIAELLSGYIEKIWESEGGKLKIAGGVAVLALLTPLITHVLIPAGLAIWFGSYVVELINDLADRIKEIKEKLAEFCKKVCESIENFVESIVEWCNKNFNAGYKYASANPGILVDTYKLRSYAGRLDTVNRRVSNVDRRLDSLYYKVCDLEDLIGTAKALWNLMQADILTSYSLRLKGCSLYLDDTADEFEKAEKNIVSQRIQVG